MGAESLLADLCLSSDGASRFDEDPEGFARAHGVDGSVVASHRRGMRVYRDLVRNNLADTLSHTLPRTRAALGDDFDALLGSYLDGSPPRTRYLREVPGAFVDHLAAREDRVGAWRVDLARFEWAEFDAAHAGEPDGESRDIEALAMERAVRFHPSVHLVALRWRAHEADADPAAAEPCAVVVYRLADDDVAIEALSLAAASLLAGLRDGRTLGDVLRGAIADLAPERQPSALASAVACVEGFVRRGIILGAA